MLEVFTIQPLRPLDPKSCLRNCAQADLQQRCTLRRFTALDVLESVVWDEPWIMSHDRYHVISRFLFYYTGIISLLWTGRAWNSGKPILFIQSLKLHHSAFPLTSMHKTSPQNKNATHSKFTPPRSLHRHPIGRYRLMISNTIWICRHFYWRLV